MSAPDAPDRWVRGVTVAAVVVVATVAAVVSFAHMATVAQRAGEGWRALLLPLSVDGLVVAASMTLLTRRRAGLPGGRLAWCALLGGVAASLAANVAAAEPTATARVVAAWPALAFAVAFELLLQQRRVPVDEVMDVPVDEVVEPVVEDSPAAHPVDDDPGEVVEPVSPVVDRPVEPVVEVDPMAARIAELIHAAHTEGRPVGRRTVARELGISEYRAGQLLARTNTNGRHR
ncbi:MAG: DUF2637 domain-containing protein [Actinomycetota bacterium]|nr:DUF2637 domain-containing protein [Actinomycetota bacterium]